MEKRNSLVWDMIDRNKLNFWFNKCCSEEQHFANEEAVSLKVAQAVNVALYVNWFETYKQKLINKS